MGVLAANMFCWVWINEAAWSWMALTTLGWQWPVDTTPMPEHAQWPHYSVTTSIRTAKPSEICSASNVTFLIAVQHIQYADKAGSCILRDRACCHVKVLLAISAVDIASTRPFRNKILHRKGIR